MRRITLALLTSIALPALAEQPSIPTPWTTPTPPHAIYGNTYYVGTQGLSAILITSPQGHILIDAPYAPNADLIEANIRQLGFRVEDIKVILNSHSHFDHAGAIARLAKDSGATVRATAAGASSLRAGGNDPSDPQHEDDRVQYPPIDAKGDIVDGTVVRLGPLALTAHITPGHTPGGTAWTWQACEGDRCKTIAYVDSLFAFAADGYRFGDHPAYVAAYRKTFARVAALPCDVLVTPHPEQGEGKTCKTYAEAGRKKLDERLAREKAK